MCKVHRIVGCVARPLALLQSKSQTYCCIHLQSYVLYEARQAYYLGLHIKIFLSEIIWLLNFLHFRFRPINYFKNTTYLHFYYFAYRCLRLLNQVVREFSREWLNMYGQQALWRLVGFYFLQQGEMGHSLWSKNPMKDKLVSGYIVSKICLCPRPAEYKFGQLRARIKYKLWKS